MKLRIGSFVLLLCIAVGVGCRKKSSHQDVSKFDGEWAVVQLLEKGRALDTQALKRLNITIAQGKLQKVEVDDTRLISAEESAIQLDPTKSPAEIDLVCMQGDNLGKARPGIFSLDGDTLQICIGEIGSPRPTDFVAGTNVSLIQLERKK